MAKNCHNDYKMKFSVDEEFPDLSQHNNHMAKVQNLPFAHEPKCQAAVYLPSFSGLSSAVGANQGDLWQAEGKVHPQRLHRG